MRFTLEKVQTDVLIVGSGAAAGMAALEACKYGLKVLMVDRGRLARSGSSATAGGGTAAAFGHTMLGKKGNPDTPDIHFRTSWSRAGTCPTNCWSAAWWTTSGTGWCI